MEKPSPCTDVWHTPDAPCVCVERNAALRRQGWFLQEFIGVGLLQRSVLFTESAGYQDHKYGTSRGIHWLDPWTATVIRTLAADIEQANALLTQHGVGYNPDALKNLAGRIQMLVNWKNAAEFGFKYQNDRADRAERALRNLIREAEYCRLGKLPSDEWLTQNFAWWLRHGSK